MSSEIGKMDESSNQLFARVSIILEHAKANIVYSVNRNTVFANWLIGREIVIELQKGEERAEYGTQLLEILSLQLNKRFGNGFSVANLKNFRQFYLTFPNRISPIRYQAGSELPDPQQIEQKSYPVGGESLDFLLSPMAREIQPAFSPHLSWSHYRALMREKDPNARGFYEKEAVDCGWSKTQLERQIQSSYYQRIVANRGLSGIDSPQRERLPGEPLKPLEMLKSPYVLEFLGLPDSSALHENRLEQAIIDNLQSFLLELGKGFSFVARQKHISFDDEDLYVDLVFYNYHLKCFLLIDLKIGKLTHSDVGQMDGYVRLFEDKYVGEGDNPTVGLILCSEKNEAVAKYSVLNDRNQIFASKYMLYLPSEEVLMNEIMRERQVIENLKDGNDDKILGWSGA